MNLKDTAVKIYLQTKLAYNTDKQPSETIKVIEKILSEMESDFLTKETKNFFEYMREIERVYLLNALENANWNVTQAAKETGIIRSHFYGKIYKHDITRPCKVSRN